MIDDISKCACSQPMPPTKQGGTCVRCLNCDVAQQVEREPDAAGAPKKRARTVADHKFDLEWKRRFRTIYPDQGGVAA